MCEREKGKTGGEERDKEREDGRESYRKKERAGKRGAHHVLEFVELDRPAFVLVHLAFGLRVQTLGWRVGG